MLKNFFLIYSFFVSFISSAVFIFIDDAYGFLNGFASDNNIFMGFLLSFLDYLPAMVLFLWIINFFLVSLIIVKNLIFSKKMKIIENEIIIDDIYVEDKKQYGQIKNYKDDLLFLENFFLEEDDTNLVGFMITDEWGKIINSSDVFNRIFKIEENNILKEDYFYKILENNENILITKKDIDLIFFNIKNKISFNLNVRMTYNEIDSCFKLIVMNYKNYFLWQVIFLKGETFKNNNDSSFEIYDNLSLPCFVVGSDGIIICENKAFKKFMGYKRGNVKLKFNNIINSIIKKEENFSFVSITLINGKTEEVLCFKSFDEEVGDKFINFTLLPMYFLGKEENIFENKIKYAVLKNKEVKNLLENKKEISGTLKIDQIPFMEMIDFIPFPFIVLSFDGILIYFNEIFINEFKGEISYGKNWLLKETEIANKLKNLKSNHNSFLINSKINSKPYKIYVGIYDCNFIITFVDVSEKNELEEQIRLSQGLQTIGQIASAVAHDFNNLLTAIMSFTYFLQERYTDEDPSSLELEQIKQNSSRAKIMIRQLLTFSRKQKLNPVIFDVNSEISSLMRTFGRLVGDNIVTKLVRGKELNKVMMDVVQFQQIITNLIVNARDAMKNGGEILIETSNVKFMANFSSGIVDIPEGEYVLIEVKDFGEGIPVENFSKIFSAYFSTKGDKGNGLGLATVMQIVKENAGFIDLKSEVGVGTSFYIYLPVCKLNDKEIESVNKNTYEILEIDNNLDLTGNQTILLVEDEIPIRMVCNRILKSKGYTVFEAENAKEGYEILEKNNFNVDLVISDVMMPGDMNGLDLIEHIHKIKPEVKALLMSGYAEDVLDGREVNGAIEFLAKPFSPDVLAFRVKKILS